MARFKIYSKDGQSVRYEGKPKYLGVYLNPSCLKFSEISSSEPIAWEVGDYVDYPRTGMRYRLYSIPQPSKEARRGSYGGAFRYSGVELYAATKELEIALFRDLVSNDNNIHFSTSPDVATFENVEGIARRIQACMDYFYPGRWEIRIADFDAAADAEILEKISTAKDFALSGATCLDALSKIYELWQDIGWIHSYENGKEVITIGYANKRIDANTTDSYLYGKGNGLTAIKKNQTNKDEFATRLYVYGSERNLPARYYNDKEILNAASVDIRNLMLPLDSWGKTDGLPDARKAYLENAEAVAKFGVIPKTHYFDSEDAGADIYPTIERLTIGEIRSVMQPTDEYYPTDRYADGDRADAVLDAINPTDDGVLKRDGKEYDAVSYISLQSVDKKVHVTGGLNNAPIIINRPLFSKVVDTDFSKGKVVVELSQTITIPDRGYTSVSARVEIGDSEEVGYGASHGYADFVATKSDDGQNWIIKLGRVSVDYSKTLYDTHKFPVYGFVTIDANTVGAESGEITIKFGPGSGSVSIKRVLDKTFIAYLKQIGFNINTQASLGKGKTISMKTGACARRNFVISDCLYSPTLDAWLITCKRQQDDTLGMIFPNSSYEIAEGDAFVLLDIAMPELYVSVAKNRLLAEGQKLLSRASKIQSNYEPSIDAKVMVESGRTLREGMFMEITDEDVVDNTTDYILIDTLSISEDESAIPTYKVTLRERRKVTYKGTPSATSATETKSVEDETEVQPNVDLTGYAKETYVNDKVSEVNNLLASMWKIDEETGNLVTDRNVRIAKNVIIGGDMSSAAKGRDTGAAGGIIGVKVGDAEYTDITDGILDMTEAFEGLDVDVDLSDYYTSDETDAKIAESLIPYAKIADVASTYATKDSLATLQTEVDNIEAILGMDEEAEGIINTWNEVKAFLDGYSSSDDLAAILSTMNADIAKRALDSDLDTLAGRVGVLESNKADKATTLAGYGITDAYTKVNVDDLLKKYLLLEAENQTIKGNIRIEGNLIIAGDMSSEGTGGNSGADGTVIGVVVNGTQYADETNGMLDLSSLMNQYALATAIPTSLPASDVYAWAKKSSLALVDVPDLSSKYLSVNGGMISGTTSTPLVIGTNVTKEVGLRLEMSSAKAWIGYTPTTGVYLYTYSGNHKLGINDNGVPFFDGNTLIHSGNIGSYAPQFSTNILLSSSSNLVGYTYETGGDTKFPEAGPAMVIGSANGAYKMAFHSRRGVLRFNSMENSALTGWKTIAFTDSDITGTANNANKLGGYSASVYPTFENQGTHIGFNLHSDYLALGQGDGHIEFYDGGWYNSAWGKVIAVNGFVGNLSGNASSATKLATARTIWGQSFDGTENVDGILTLNYSTTSRATGVEVVSTTGGEASIGFKLNDTNRAVVGVWDTALNLWTQAKGTAISIPIATGNVGIGTTNPAYKLDVNGTANFSGAVSVGNANSSTLKLLRSGYHSYIIGSSSLAFSINGDNNNIALALWEDKSASFAGAVTMSSTFTAAGGTLSGTLYSTTNQGFNVTRTSDWAYYQLKSGSVAWDIATTATAASSNIKQANALEFRFNGGGNWGFSLRPETSFFGVGVLVSNTGECSLGFLSSSSSSSDKKPQWVMGAMSTTVFGVYNTARSKYGFTIDDYFKLSTNSITIRGESGSYINNRATLVLNSANKQAADIVFKCNSSTTGDYGQWAISSRSENDGRFSIFRGAQNIAVASEEELFTIKANGDVKIAKNLIIAGDMSSTSDMRLKHRIEDVTLDLNTMAEMPIFTFRWKDGRDDRLHLGSSAQYWEKPAPWLVMEDSFKTLNYAVLGVAGVKALAVTAVDHETRIKMLERKVNELETENRRLRYGN